MVFSKTKLASFFFLMLSFFLYTDKTWADNHACQCSLDVNTHVWTLNNYNVNPVADCSQSSLETCARECIGAINANLSYWKSQICTGTKSVMYGLNVSTVIVGCPGAVRVSSLGETYTSANYVPAIPVVSAVYSNKTVCVAPDLVSPTLGMCWHKSNSPQIPGNPPGMILVSGKVVSTLIKPAVPGKQMVCDFSNP